MKAHRSSRSLTRSFPLPLFEDIYAQDDDAIQVTIRDQISTRPRISQMAVKEWLTPGWLAKCGISGLGACRVLPCSAATALLAVMSCCRTDGTVAVAPPIGKGCSDCSSSAQRQGPCLMQQAWSVLGTRQLSRRSCVLEAGGRSERLKVYEPSTWHSITFNELSRELLLQTCEQPCVRFEMHDSLEEFIGNWHGLR